MAEHVRVLELVVGEECAEGYDRRKQQDAANHEAPLGDGFDGFGALGDRPTDDAGDEAE